MDWGSEVHAWTTSIYLALLVLWALCALCMDVRRRPSCCCVLASEDYAFLFNSSLKIIVKINWQIRTFDIDLKPIVCLTNNLPVVLFRLSHSWGSNNIGVSGQEMHPKLMMVLLAAFALLWAIVLVNWNPPVQACIPVTPDTPHGKYTVTVKLAAELPCLLEALR